MLSSPAYFEPSFPTARVVQDKKMDRVSSEQARSKSKGTILTRMSTVPYPKMLDWSIIQLGCAIVCGCLPCLRPLLPDSFKDIPPSLRSFVEPLLRSRKSSSKTGNSYRNLPDPPTERPNAEFASGGNSSWGNPDLSTFVPMNMNDAVPLRGIGVWKDVTVEPS